jgi:TatD DNase family protein
MIDTHCHIYLPDFSEDLDEVLSRTEEQGISDICMPAIDFVSLEQMEQIRYTGIRFHKMAGVHPCEVRSFDAMIFRSKLHDRAVRPDIVAIGETGLDYYWSTDFVREQQESLRIHCEISREVKKPVVLHNRESTIDLLNIIADEQDGRLRGIWHCFNGSLEEGKKAIDLGLMLGIGGVLTFKNSGVDKTVKDLPLDKMVLETDAPYLTPAPFRGKRNEPSYLRFVLKKLSAVFELPEDEIRKQTTANARKLFDLNAL